MSFRSDNLDLELRVATVPTVGGQEDVVLRLLASSGPLPLSKLGLRPPVEAEVERLIARPHGLFLCVGPTGSGKTTTLHSALKFINVEGTKIWTAEDPVEISQKGLRQVQVVPHIGFTFAAALRAFLRADPDVIMIGEMRDHETAHMAVESALTGHLVVSTLHTNSAPETITRLLDMELDPFSFADSLVGVLAQRLGRTLCKHCKRDWQPDDVHIGALRSAYGAEAWDRDVAPTLPETLVLQQADGCARCNHTGLKGRIAVHELLVADNDEMRAAISRRASVSELRDLAIEQGMRTLVQDGVLKVLDGRMSLKQVLSVCATH